MSLKQDILSLLRVCPICGSNAGRIELCCEYCWSQKFKPWAQGGLEKQYLKPEGIPVFSLYRWGTGRKGEQIKELISSLKGDNGERALRKLAHEFSLLRMGEAVQDELIFCPAPASVPGNIDHAYLWAQVLSEKWCSPMVNILKRGSSEVQKTLSVDQRRETVLELKNGCKRPLEAKIIFADDVITSGSTARAAWIALGRPPRFEVWTVACRPKLFLI